MNQSHRAITCPLICRYSYCNSAPHLNDLLFQGLQVVPSVPELSLLDDSLPLEAPMPERRVLAQINDHRLNQTPIKDRKGHVHRPAGDDRTVRKVKLSSLQLVSDYRDARCLVNSLISCSMQISFDKLIDNRLVSQAAPSIDERTPKRPVSPKHPLPLSSQSIPSARANTANLTSSQALNLSFKQKDTQSPNIAKLALFMKNSGANAAAVAQPSAVPSSVPQEMPGSILPQTTPTSHKSNGCNHAAVGYCSSPPMQSLSSHPLHTQAPPPHAQAPPLHTQALPSLIPTHSKMPPVQALPPDMQSPQPQSYQPCRCQCQCSALPAANATSLPAHSSVNPNPLNVITDNVFRLLKAGSESELHNKSTATHVRPHPICNQLYICELSPTPSLSLCPAEWTGWLRTCGNTKQPSGVGCTPQPLPS